MDRCTLMEQSLHTEVMERTKVGGEHSMHSRLRPSEVCVSTKGWAWQVGMDLIHKNGLNNAHRAPGVLLASWLHTEFYKKSLTFRGAQATETLKSKPY